MARYVLGDREYPTKKAAREQFTRILNDTDLGAELVGDDAALVGLLLTAGRHPESVEKIGPGIGSVCVRPAAYGTRCFWVRRLDGTETDFSYLTALDGAPSPKAAATAALRGEIADQIESFRGGVTPGSVCELCGSPVAVSEAHIDHADPTFDQLAARFATACGGWGTLHVECVGAYGRRLADRSRAVVWWHFHDATARLRLTHPACNLGRTRTQSCGGGA